jgi:hypothetical protein
LTDISTDTLEIGIEEGGENKKLRSVNICKYKRKFRYIHPEQVCKEYLKKYKCDIKLFSFRHPNICKWLTSKSGSKQESECDYLHITLADEELNKWKC